MLDEAMRRIRDLFQGATTASGSVTLATSATTTTVDLSARRLCSTGSHVTLSPTNAAAASETWHVVPSRGQFVIHHASAGTERTFTYEVRTPYGRA
jgi:hypothetical protein